MEKSFLTYNQIEKIEVFDKINNSPAQSMNGFISIICAQNKIDARRAEGFRRMKRILMSSIVNN